MKPGKKPIFFTHCISEDEQTICILSMDMHDIILNCWLLTDTVAPGTPHAHRADVELSALTMQGHKTKQTALQTFSIKQGHLGLSSESVQPTRLGENVSSPEHTNKCANKVFHAQKCNIITDQQAFID